MDRKKSDWVSEISATGSIRRRRQHCRPCLGNSDSFASDLYALATMSGIAMLITIIFVRGRDASTNPLPQRPSTGESDQSSGQRNVAVPCFVPLLRSGNLLGLAARRQNGANEVQQIVEGTVDVTEDDVGHSKPQEILDHSQVKYEAK